MAVEEPYVRIVALRKGRVRASEFMLRPGENGLSLFGVDRPTLEEVIEAVRQAGKQGELAAVGLDGIKLGKLGLKLVRTPGGTPNAKVNAFHWEARLSWWRRVLLFLRGESVYDYFNQHIAPKLHAMYEKI